MSTLPKLEVASTAPRSEVEAVFVFQDSKKKPIVTSGPYRGTLQSLIKAQVFLAEKKSVEFVRNGGKGKSSSVVFVGLGQAKDLDAETLRQAASNLWRRVHAEKGNSLSIRMESLDHKDLGPEFTNEKLIRLVGDAIAMSHYHNDKYKSSSTAKEGKPKTRPTVTFLLKDKKAAAQLKSEAAASQAVGDAVDVCRRLSDEPANVANPEYCAQQAKSLAREYGIKCSVLNESQIKKEKMDLFLSVGAGSERESRIVVLDYAPKGAKKTIALVGKGITFDSGGISIKPSGRMEDMKHDMTGAATMLAATLLASKLGAQNRVIAILGFAENMPSGSATVPSSIVKARSGKTVEIINTDAEGRLILADLLDYAQDFKPDAIINAATLTGAVGVALGKICAGIMGNDEKLIQAVIQSSQEEGEKLWQLPLHDEYLEDMKSRMADLKNSCNNGNGGAIRGGIFLKQFVKKDMPWVHLDIASTAYDVSHLPYVPKGGGASGLHVRTLAHFVSQF